jgi:hypothetical protein
MNSLQPEQRLRKAGCEAQSRRYCAILKKLVGRGVDWLAVSASAKCIFPVIDCVSKPEHLGKAEKLTL